VKILTTFALSLMITLNIFSQDLSHQLGIEINIEENYIKVKDNISFSESYLSSHPALEFSLNAELEASSTDKKMLLEETGLEDSEDMQVFLKNDKIRFKGRKNGMSPIASS